MPGKKPLSPIEIAMMKKKAAKKPVPVKKGPALPKKGKTKKPRGKM